MNKVHFNLKQTKDREALSQIMVLTTVNGRRIRVYTKQRVRPAEWDNQHQCCAIANGVPQRRAMELTLVNERLKYLRSQMNRTDFELSQHGVYLSADDVRGVVTESLKVREVDTTPLAYLQMLVDNYACTINHRGVKGCASSQVTYRVALKRLFHFCKVSGFCITSWDNFDKNFFNQFTNHLFNYQFVRKGVAMRYSGITVANTLKVIRNLLRQAYENDVSDNLYFNKVKTKVQHPVCDKIYLNEQEIKRLADLDSLSESEREVRDLFLISCYSALRISDLNQLGKALIKDNVISLYQQKTRNQVSIPILKEIAPLIKYYQHKKFPVLQDFKANAIIKQLAERAGITDMVQKRENRGGEIRIVQERKCDMVSFHTARRSCITNLFLRGYPANYLTILSVHRSMQSLQRYIRASTENVSHSFMEMLRVKNDI